MEKRSEYVNVGVVVKTPKSNLDRFFEILSNMENVKIVYKYVSWLPLWVVEKEPPEASEK